MAQFSILNSHPREQRRASPRMRIEPLTNSCVSVPLWLLLSCDCAEWLRIFRRSAAHGGPDTKGSLENNSAVSPDTESGRGSDQLLNSQFSSEVAVGLGTDRFFRMRIENWELVRFSRSCILPSYFCASSKIVSSLWSIRPRALITRARPK